MSISVVVLTKNSEKTLKRCLQSVSFADELIIVDDFSVDKTVDIAKRYKAKIYKRKLNSDFAKQRNFGLSKSSCDWVLFIDSDEVYRGPRPNLKGVYDGYYMYREDIFLGKKIKYGEAGGLKTLRLGRRGSGLWKRKVHEYWDIHGEIGLQKARLEHYSHPSVSDFISKINLYAIIHQSENKQEGKESNLLKVVLIPFFKFFHNFIFKKGFLDGVHGFVYAVVMSFHSFLVWSSLWIGDNRKLK